VRARARTVEADLRKKMENHERELDRRAEKCRTMEAQLTRQLTGQATATLSSSRGVTAAPADAEAGLQV
jgi:hypothetical protein